MRTCVFSRFELDRNTYLCVLTIGLVINPMTVTYEASSLTSGDAHSSRPRVPPCDVFFSRRLRLRQVSPPSERDGEGFQRPALGRYIFGHKCALDPTHSPQPASYYTVQRTSHQQERMVTLMSHQSARRERQGDTDADGALYIT